METKEREIFLNYLNETGTSGKTSHVLSDAKYDAVLHYLKNPQEKVDPHFKQWAKSRGFELMNIENIGIIDAIVVPKKDAQVSFLNQYMVVTFSQN